MVNTCRYFIRFNAFKMLPVGLLIISTLVLGSTIKCDPIDIKELL
jgi:hypothetical protein